jgi:glutaredoxin
MASELASTLSKSDVVILSSTGCPFCRKVTQAFAAKKVAFLEIDYDELDGALLVVIRGGGFGVLLLGA